MNKNASLEGIQPLLGINGLTLIFISILFIADISIIFDLSYLRPIFAFIILFIPSIILLNILRLNKIEFLFKLALAMGLSIIIVLSFTLIWNYLGVLANIKPLSTYWLLIIFNILILFFIILNFIINRHNTIKIPQINLNSYDKIVLIFGCFLPLLSIFGTTSVEQGSSNTIIMFFVLLIPIYIIMISIFNNKLSSNIYPYALILMSFSLVSMLFFRFIHIYGNDIHIEYNYFYSILNQMEWIPLKDRPVYSSLSASLLPVVFVKLMKINPEFFYRLILVFIASFTPLVVYFLSKIYIKNIYAFFAAIFYMSQLAFLTSAASGRTTSAIFFSALVLLLYFSKVEDWKKNILIILFLFGAVLSHYSTTYILFFMLLAITISTSIISRKFTFKKNITIGMVVLLFSIIFVWYSQISGTTFESGVGFLKNVFFGLNNSFTAELKSGNLSLLSGGGLAFPLLSRANLFFTLTTFLMISLGSLFVLMKYKKTIDLFKDKKPEFFKKKMNLEFLMIISVSILLLLLTVLLPYVSKEYDIYRIYGVVTIVLASCFVIGCVYFSKISKLNKPVLLILIILIPYFLFTTGFVYQIFGIQGNVVFNNQGETIDLTEIRDSESLAISWLAKNGNNSHVVFTPDFYGANKLLSQSNGGIILDNINKFYFLVKKRLKGYIYFSYVNTHLGKIFANGTLEDMNNYQDNLVNSSKIYDSEYSQIWVAK